MKTPKADGPQEPSNNRRHREDGSRPRRGGEHGPLGFSGVMRDVRGGAGGAGGMPTSTTAGMPGFDPALAQALQLDAGAQAAIQMGALQSVGQELAKASYGVHDATEALAQQDRSPTMQAQVQPHVPTALGRMTPSALMETVLDEATKLEIEQASRDLHVELEPADLGPVVVRLRKGPDGTLDISFRAREGEAARVLESGIELLRGRLAEAGFTTNPIDVTHDADLRLTGVSTG